MLYKYVEWQVFLRVLLKSDVLFIAVCKDSYVIIACGFSRNLGFAESLWITSRHVFADTIILWITV